MMFTSRRTTAKEMSLAIISLLLVLGGAFIAAQLTIDWQPPLFSLSPPCPKLPCNPTPFVESQRLDLNRTFFTAWAALILIIPALCTFWFRQTSEAARYWLAFWTVSFVAFLVHFYWSVFIMFGGEWSRIFDKVENGRRVTVPVFDTIFTVWWGMDVLLAWLIASENRLIRIQRVLVHISAFVLFLLGSVKEGELNGSNGKPAWSVALGMIMGIAVSSSFLIWCIRWVRNRRTRVAPAV
jgi:hypothetical protein